MDSVKNISIIIITYNRPEEILALIKNIANLDFIDSLLEEVIIINNKSTVSYSELKSYFSYIPHVPIKYIEADQNLGVSKGRNFAIMHSKAPLLVLVDDDAEFQDKDVLKKICDISNSNKMAGIIAMKVLYHHDKSFQVNAFPHKSFKKKKMLSEFETYYFAGCGNIILREAFNKAGGFPDNFFYGMEEYDLSYRILNNGYKIIYTDKVVLLHKESPKGRQTKSEKLKGMWINKSKVAWRYLPIVYFLTTSTIWAIYFLLKSKFNLIFFFDGIRLIAKIPSEEKRNKINKSTLNYLKIHEARMLY